MKIVKLIVELIESGIVKILEVGLIMISIAIITVGLILILSFKAQ